MAHSQSEFVQVQNGRFFIHQTPYYFLGTNFWYGINLAGAKEPGDQDRLIRELDRLNELGINNLRIMGATEGPNDAPWRMVPTLQVQKGTFDSTLWAGLDFLLVQMAQRNMKAVVCLNNFWPWSGGMSQYVQWETGDSIPYPPPAQGGNWNRYQNYAARFYQNEPAQEAYEQVVRMIVGRTNSLSGIAYKDDPTIMAWQLANEPRGMRVSDAYVAWIQKTARLIKSLDPHHLVSIGSEGLTSVPLYANNRFQEVHALAEIDYLTCHIWIQNWGWYLPQQHSLTFGRAKRKAKSYLRKHEKIAETLGKPLVLEEFGIARDGDDHAPAAPTLGRNAYYDFIFEQVYRSASKGGALVGVNFWAWGGEGRPRVPKAIWQAGDDLIGDPPHEHQGWYSVYDQDSSTLAGLKEWTQRFDQLSQ